MATRFNKSEDFATILVAYRVSKSQREQTHKDLLKKLAPADRAIEEMEAYLTGRGNMPASVFGLFDTRECEYERGRGGPEVTRYYMSEADAEKAKAGKYGTEWTVREVLTSNLSKRNLLSIQPPSV